MFTTTEENEAVFPVFCQVGISSQDKFCLELEVTFNMEPKKLIIIFSKNCTFQQVNKAENATHKHCSPLSLPLLTAFARSDKKKPFTVS